MNKATKQKSEGRLRKHLAGKFQECFQEKRPSKDNPMVRASCVWAIVSDQLEHILGKEIYRQWFSSIVPMVIADHMIVLQSPRDFNVRWINTHYHNLVNLLLSFQDPTLKAVFVQTER